MLTHPERSSGTWAGLGVLALGILIGALARPSRWFDPTSPAPERVPFPALVPATPPETPPENGLPTIELVVPDSSAAVLERVRAEALERGIIRQTDADTVPAEFLFEGQRLAADLRIKGDWTDHVESDRWSYRIHLKKGSFRGMREFSIQTPRTRGFLWEWLMHEACRHEGVLVPRSTFLNVVQNGHALGVYFLEEHFEKELLESQGRREGPIVVWDEEILWARLLQEGNVPAKGVRPLESRLTEPAHTVAPAEVRAYGEKHLSASDTLDKALLAALDQMKALSALAVLEQPEEDRFRVDQALRELRGRTLEQLVDVDRLGCAHALASVFQVEHSLAWHNMRYYRDPVQARLEPILFDNGAQEPSGRDPVPWRARDLTAAFAQSPRYYEALFTHLGRMLRSDWLDGLFASIEPEFSRFEAALRAEGLPPGFSAGEMKQRLRAQVVWLRKACLPTDGINFEASYELSDPKGSPGKGWLEVFAWATTRSPVVVDGFRFSNGTEAAAAGVLVPGSSGARVRGQSVVLPVDGSAACFRFPMDERLASLEKAEKIKRAIRQGLSADETLDLDVDALHHLLASEESGVERLAFRRALPGPVDDGRPEAPSLDRVLERHPFLRYDAARGELFGLAGTWDVDGDLVLPAGVPLRLVAGTTLRFAGDAVLVADAPLRFEGSEREPIVLEPLEGLDRWRGILVLNAGGRSEWNDVVVRHTDAVARGGWIVTGGVTFYRSPLSLTRCRFEGTLAEDGLNVFGTDLHFEGVTFSDCFSDSFDGDFVTGEIANCLFQDGQADGIDVSGSRILVRDCRFLRLVDKACSIGERSHARIEGGQALDVGIGVASKDDSDAEVNELAIQARHYALAAFVKKPEYGAARLRAHGPKMEGVRGVALSQTGCTLEIDGAVWPTEDVDVEASYREGILGHAK